MSDALGLSIGTTNLVAGRPGRQPVSRRSVLTLWEGRPAEVGVPSQNPELTSPNLTQGGLVLRGFVERIGDPVPLVAADGSAHRGEALVVAALEAMARTADDGIPPAAIVVSAPAHWGPAAIGALRGALRASPMLSPGGVPPLIVSDAAAALAALRTDPGLPARGVVALCDFGGSGTSITLADAGADFALIGETVRFGDFSGDQVDRALLNYVLAGVRAAAHEETGSTAAVGALTRLREQCRLAKERLSAEAATGLTADLPGYRSEVRLTRGELDAIVAEPFTGFLDAFADILERNRIPVVDLAAIATVGGGAAMPMISQRLSEAFRVPVISTPQPGAVAAVGAAALAGRGPLPDALAGRGPLPDAPTGLSTAAADAPTSLAPTAWAAGTAGAAATESASDGSPSATFRALAWSQDEDTDGEPVPYTGADYTGGDYAGGDYGAAPPTGPRPMVEFEPDDDDAMVLAPPLPWYRRPPLLFGIAAVVAAVAVGGLAITLTANESSPTTTTTRVTKPGEPSGSAATNAPVPQTITVTGGNGETTVSTITPTTTAQPTTTTPTTTTTTTTPTTTTTTTPTTTTTTPTTTTTTTTTPTTTRTTTTTPPTTTTTQPPTTTAAPPTTTAEPPPPTTTIEPAVTTQAVIPDEPLPETKPAPAE